MADRRAPASIGRQAAAGARESALRHAAHSSGGDALSRLRNIVGELDSARSLARPYGTIVEATPTSVHVAGLSHFAHIHDFVEIETENGWRLGVVAAVRGSVCVAVPIERDLKVRLASRTRLSGRPELRPHASWKGRTVDALGRPIDGLGELADGEVAVDLDRSPPPPLQRRQPKEPLSTGVRAIDAFTPLVSGQRLGIFAGSGVGKSTLLAMLCASVGASTVVIGLVGERGREVRDFLEEALGPRRERVVAVVSTSDDSPMMRRFAPRTAMAISEYFRDQGENVLLIVDSLTRFAHAEREYALAAEQLPLARGYPPSVFGELAHLLERAGPGDGAAGAITMICSVLIDGDDFNDPVSDAVRGILDGHVILDRSIAAGGRFPAIDILRSISRLAPRAWTPAEAKLAADCRRLIALYEDTRDLRMLGDYRPGSDPALDHAVKVVPDLYRLLAQAPGESAVALFEKLSEVAQLEFRKAPSAR